ncbi:MAG: response regulator [Spirochaetales bacterium]|nr:response regulator [Spirochaetales bacterium]
MSDSVPQVLVVDDDAIALDVAVRMLSKLGIHAYSALDGQQALEISRQKALDLVFLDWELPDLSGIEVAKILRSTLGDELPIVGLSGYSFNDKELDSDSTLFSAHLLKPVSLADFEKLLREFSLEVKRLP